MGQRETDPDRMALIDQLLGPEPARADQPTSAELVAARSGKLTDSARLAEVQAYLDHNPALGRAIDDGLEELARLERPPQATRAPALAELVDRLAGVFRGALSIEVAPQLVAAATDDLDAPPALEDRQVLLEDPALRLVYHREGGRAVLMAFSLEEGVDPPMVRCWLSQQELTGEQPQARIQRFVLGATTRLAGRSLRVELQLGDRVAECHWTLSAG